MMPQLGQPPRTSVRQGSVPSRLRADLPLIAGRLSAMLDRIWEQLGFAFGFLVALSVFRLMLNGRLLTVIPPIVPISLGFLLVALLKGGVVRIATAWRANAAIFWLYLITLGAEVSLMLYHASWSNWFWVAGRGAFFVVFLAAVAVGKDVKTAASTLRGLTCGTAVLGLMAIVQASRIVDLPFAAEVYPARQFGPIQMPFPSTLGIDTTPDKLGIRFGLALSTLVVSSWGRERIIRSSGRRAVLAVVITIGALITQQRGIYLEVFLTVALGLCFLLVKDRSVARLASTQGSWLVALLFAVSLVVANVVFVRAPPKWIVDVGSAKSVENVSIRIDALATGWRLFKQAPLLGIGRGRFMDVFHLRTSIHNHFWDHLVSTGLVGGIPYLLFHLLIMVSALSLFARSRGITRAVASVLSASVLITYLAYQFAPLFFVAVFAVTCGLVVALNGDDCRGLQPLAPVEADAGGDCGA